MKNKIWLGAGIAVLAVLASAEIYFGIRLVRIGILPTRYLLLLLLAAVVFSGLIGWCMFPRVGKYEKSKHIARRVVAMVLAAVLTAGCFLGADAVKKVDETMEAVTNTTVISDLIGIYVLAENPAADMKDAAAFRFGVTESYDWENTQAVLAELKLLLGKEPTVVRFATPPEMIDGLYAGTVDAMILNSAFTTILEELPPYADFPAKTRMLYEHVLKKEVPVQPTQPPQNMEPTYIFPSEPAQVPVVQSDAFVLYLSGSDTRSQILTTSRSDVNILAVINPTIRQILLVNTPRDYYIPNPAGNGALDKLTHCGIYGIDCSVTALEWLYGINVDHYGQVNFTGFETLVDAVGGVRIYSEVAFTSTHGGFPVAQGYNDFDGFQAVCYARERYSFMDGDHSRGRNQMKLIKAILEKLTAGNLLANYTEILDSMQGMFVTSMPREDITAFVRRQLSDNIQWEILSYAVSGANGDSTTYSMPYLSAYVMIPYMDTVEKASDLMNRVIAGQRITQEDLQG